MAIQYKDCAADAKSDFLPDHNKSSTGILMHDKQNLYKITQNKPTNYMPNRQALFVRCCLIFI